MKKKGPFSRFALFIYAVILIVLIAYILEPTSKETTKKKTPTSSTQSNKEKNQPKIEDKEESSSIFDWLKKEDLSDADFDKRLAKIGAKAGDKVFIRIFKKESLLEAWMKVKGKYVLFKHYPICKYSGYLGPKLKQGDKQSPEGFYKVTRRLLNPNSKYHLAFNLGYPNKYDRAHKRTGSFLMVHGECVSIGCYAMTNSKIEEIYTLVDKALRKGQKYVQVHAYPFFMTEENMVDYQDSKWYDFWTELKKGYDYFEAEKVPPNIKVKNKHYTIHEANE
ncbi:MAG: murein L,D-transpeptidase [Sulfurovum sp.]|nr:murein L,D-transpeptidase [Sulfurovum sp.]